LERKKKTTSHRSPDRALATHAANTARTETPGRISGEMSPPRLHYHRYLNLRSSYSVGYYVDSGSVESGLIANAMMGSSDWSAMRYAGSAEVVAAAAVVAAVADVAAVDAVAVAAVAASVAMTWVVETCHSADWIAFAAVAVLI
jgi:hypothetical protein